MGWGHDGKTVYYCVDLEASGPVPGLFNMVSIGGVEVRWDGARHVRGRGFYFELVPDFPGFEDGAMKIHGLSEAHLRAQGRPGREVMQAISSWVKEGLKPGEKPLFVGHNAPFDWMFVAYYFAWAGLENPFGYNALDTKALAMGKHRCFFKATNKERLLELYPRLRAPEKHMEHNALADAEFQADILCALLDD